MAIGRKPKVIFKCCRWSTCTYGCDYPKDVGLLIRATGRCQRGGRRYYHSRYEITPKVTVL